MGYPTAEQLQAQLQSTLYGYISGSDLAGWCDPQLLLGAVERLPTALQRAAAQALSEVTSALQNRYDLTTELLKTDVVPPVASTLLTAGAVTGTKIILPGGGLTVAPLVSVVNDPDDTTGSGATVVSAISQGYVNKLHLLTFGRHYHTAPLVEINDGGGTGATAICTISKWGQVNSLTITNGGAGYTSIPTIEFVSVDGFGGGATAVAAISMGKLNLLTVTAGGTNYTLPPALVFDMSLQAPDARNAKLVKIIAIYTIRNAMGQAQNISEMMQNFFKMADTMTTDLKAGFDSLPMYEASKQIRSDIAVIRDNFRTLG